ncbi:hypothetical protein Cgig2_013727 [Carnegiea gigantea]|uniref:Uncharacterized protein n=1 Tax=Carnegiea gigantea TaxID=171969 RepID=A0A9Q1K7J5_9CARY|nr:hypothetical protein Cgig2_013727 [Carnegiea gigantea]
MSYLIWALVVMSLQGQTEGILMSLLKSVSISFVVGLNGLLFFPFFKVSYLDIDLLDHVPILLGTQDNVDMSQRSRRRRFEIVWAEDQSYEEIIRDVKERAHILDDICDWRPKEEILFWQRSRVNSSLFHSKASAGKAINTISKLKATNGSWAIDVQRM